MAISVQKVRSLRVLSVLFELAEQQTRVDVPLQRVGESLPADLKGLDLQEECRRLKRSGWVDYFESLAGIGAASVTPAGEDAYQAFDAQRRSMVERRKELRDTYLRWVYEEVESGRTPTPDLFLAQGFHYLGVPYSDEDVQQAGSRLEADGLIEGPGAWGHGGPLRPRTTSRGSRLVESGLSVSDASFDREVVHSTVVHGNANIAHNSSGFSQSITVTDSSWIEAAKGLSQLLAQSLPALTAQVRSDVSREVDAFDAEIAGKPDRGAVRRIVARIGGILERAGSDVLAKLLTQEVNAFLSGLPQ